MSNGDRLSFRAPLRTPFISSFGVGKLNNISEGGLLLSDIDFSDNYSSLIFSLPRFPSFNTLSDHHLKLLKIEDISSDIIKVDVTKAWRSGEKCGVSFLSLKSSDEQLILNYCSKISENFSYVLGLFESEENSERLFKLISILGHTVKGLSLDVLRSKLIHDYTHMR